MPAEFTLGLVERDELGPAEHWILDRCNVTLEAAEKAYAGFEFGEVARLLYDAIWSEFCDWYVELAKIGLQDPAASAQRKQAIWSTLTWVLDRYLRLLHPLMPMLTEEIWSKLPHLATDPDLLIVAAWPTPGDTVVADSRAAEGTTAVLELITQVRAARAEAGIAAADVLPASIWLPEGASRDAYAEMESIVARLARIHPTLVASRSELDAQGSGGLTVITARGDARLSRSEADRERESARLRKELAQIESQLAAAEARLSDDSFVTRAPVNVVEGARSRVKELRAQADALRERIGEE
jgi:valyl-tRNA synthetase